MPSRTPPAHEEHAWIVVDHELLSRLGAHATRTEWERTLKRTGLWDLEGLDGAEGRDLAEVRAALRDEPALPAGPTARWPHVAHELRQAAWIIAAIGAFVWILTPTTSAVLLGLAATAWVIGWFGPRSLQAPPRALAGERATRALRRFLSHSFITTARDRVVENTPHRAYLELRLEELDRALRVAELQVAELREVRTRVARANERIGRPIEDVETARLTAAIAEKEATRERVAGVRALLAERLVEMERQLDRLRLVVERRALSERVSRLTDAGARQDPVERVAAEVEVDVADIERRVHELALETGDADARLRAVLEVVSAAPTRS